MTTFSIPGKPFAKQRPKFSRRIGRAFTPKETRNFEDMVRAMALQHFPEPLTGAVEIAVLAIFEPPPSWSKKKRAGHMHQLHTQRPDFDNLQKAVCDGLNRVAFADDSQIAKASCEKRWGERAQTIVSVAQARSAHA